jgi:hypothetical protein
MNFTHTLQPSKHALDLERGYWQVCAGRVWFVWYWLLICSILSVVASIWSFVVRGGFDMTSDG